ncbi:hypothetical protein RIVM261_014340 [Rivularia sp. IAM M-261]|nr:hypothetical protein CAL7716_073540 [Calothrix sp. PCC 7716]GJD16478.1 hypothetical protein RIVM261_014340 [Rivularia sp. IAM M-261]
MISWWESVEKFECPIEYALFRLGKLQEAIQYYDKAINLDAEYREMVKTDVDFDGIRDNVRFMALL